MKEDFIDWDKDRFYVCVPNGVKLGVSSLEIATVDNPDSAYNDNPTEIDIIDVGNGIDSITESMILVSNDEDDDFADSGSGTDDQVNDRTHKVQLDGAMMIKSITIRGSKRDISLKIPVPSKRQIDIALVRMKVPHVHTLSDINESVKFVKESYCQVGLRINANVQEIDWPQLSPNRGDGIMRIFSGDNYANGYLIGPLSNEYKQFVDSAGSNGVNLFFLTSAYYSKGIAITPSQLLQEEGEIEGKYLNKAFINFAAGSIVGSTTQHELLHILAYRTDGVNDHGEQYFNILNADGTDTQSPVLRRKRINEAQEERIYQHGAVRLIP